MLEDMILAETALPSGFGKFFVAGGWLVWVVLLPMSLLTIKLIVEYFATLRRTKLLPPTLPARVEKELSGKHDQKLLEFLQKQENMLGRTLCAGLEQTARGREAMDVAMAEVLEQESAQWMRRLEWLNVIGNVAPMVGLFGTVWGMIEAFDGIVQAGGQPEAPDLAKGISVALVTTWWGLLVAIPALTAYGTLRNRVDALAAETAVTAEHLLRERG